MKITLRRATDRGFFDFGWLQTYHSFSFGDYHDLKQMGFGTLRVINQDTVQPGHGFATHPHHDMEILTYVLKGAVTHKDTMGNETTITAGQIQCMSAGSGINHSEHNSSLTEPLELLQIWIFPNKKQLVPSYQQKTYAATASGFLLLAAPLAEGALVSIHQDARLFRVTAKAGECLSYQLLPQRQIWVQLIAGQVKLNEQLLQPGDGAGIRDAGHLELVAVTPLELLLFDLGAKA